MLQTDTCHPSCRSWRPRPKNWTYTHAHRVNHLHVTALQPQLSCNRQGTSARRATMAVTIMICQSNIPHTLNTQDKKTLRGQQPTSCCRQRETRIPSLPADNPHVHLAAPKHASSACSTQNHSPATDNDNGGPPAGQQHQSLWVPPHNRSTALDCSTCCGAGTSIPLHAKGKQLGACMMVHPAPSP